MCHFNCTERPNGCTTNNHTQQPDDALALSVLHIDVNAHMHNSSIIIAAGAGAGGVRTTQTQAVTIIMTSICHNCHFV